VLTAAGDLVLLRRYYWGPNGAGGCYPSDQRAGIDVQNVSAGARELCCIMGLTSDFRAASANLKRVGGLCVCRERLRQIVERAAAAVAAARDAGLIPASWSAKTDTLERDRLYVGVDGLLVRAVTQVEKDKRRKAHAIRRQSRGKAGIANARELPTPRPGTDQTFKEIKFAVFYDQPKDHRHLLCTAGDGAELGAKLRGHAAQVGIEHVKQKVALTDGAPWIARQLKINLPMLSDHVLDFYHLAEHVHAAAKLCLGEGTTAASAWAHARLDEAKGDGPTPVLAAIAVLTKGVRAPLKREALRRLRGYINDRIEMLDYKRFRRRGWDIGSGPTEAGGKDLAARIRGVGMKWDLDHAADMMNLQALYESNQAESYWKAQARAMGNTSLN
jgi:hypothetical protein